MQTKRSLHSGPAWFKTLLTDVYVPGFESVATEFLSQNDTEAESGVRAGIVAKDRKSVV